MYALTSSCTHMLTVRNHNAASQNTLQLTYILPCSASCLSPFLSSAVVPMTTGCFGKEITFWMGAGQVWILYWALGQHGQQIRHQTQKMFCREKA